MLLRSGQHNGGITLGIIHALKFDQTETQHAFPMGRPLSGECVNATKDVNALGTRDPIRRKKKQQQH